MEYRKLGKSGFLGESLKGIRRESIELCTKVFHPTGTGKNDRGLSRKHIMEACHASLRS